MKTRTLTNKNRDSYRVDVIDKTGELTSQYFSTKKEAKEYVKWRHKLEKYKDFI